MRENFVIREERHPVAIVIMVIAILMEFFCGMATINWFILALFVDSSFFVAAFGALIASLIWWAFEKMVQFVGKEFFDCEFEIDGLKVSYRWETNKDRVLKVNDRVIDCLAIKYQPGEMPPNSNDKRGLYAKTVVSGNHVLKLFHTGNLRYPDCCILLDDVIIVEQGRVYVDKVHEILSGSAVSINQPLPIDTGVMPPFQTTPSHSNAEKTVAPRTKRYAIVGEEGAFASHLFPITDMLVLGRDAAECGLAFPADTAGVSRVHCKLVVEADGLCVYDLGSTYGTVVNNNKTISTNQMMKLNHGDTITIGSSQTFVVKEM